MLGSDVLPSLEDLAFESLTSTESGDDKVDEPVELSSVVEPMDVDSQEKLRLHIRPSRAPMQIFRRRFLFE